jgi:hypothetical protein
MKYILVLLFLFPALMVSQEDDDLLSEIDDKIEDTYKSAAFKGLKIVNFNSTKMVSKKEMYFVVSHRFGSLKTGFKDFFGLDQAVTRLNLIYGITDFINVGVSRSSYRKMYESSLKIRLIREKKGGFPFTVVSSNNILINTSLDKDILPGLEFRSSLCQQYFMITM